ncbi:hypothetical protein [Xanthomonas oryzae]|uniref:hypothetical protein n=1 Tax=Xanthomonas oryzae TaxID=347 RepID=UPI0006AC363C|nr:hypothetical protein [Xanthomonas oryzae]KOR47226.1 hypothetical protein ADT27_08770 [Xanthomonas oryzae]MEC5078988.1 hypothetical protein [Xanthomonas oryzae pv. oryzicola]MEC5112622.1 hypothetical protein [Xanthomonas oryzae pv. oryzicola]QEO97858.1 hypothetical protein XOCgx_2869 [Xanthomonas oryzae pv. oryzicola]QGH66422.1 hypothetical protein GHV42_12860 [Xanthomonas oryzae pv. oryzicola]
MPVERLRHVDCGEPDASGAYDHYYEYDIYRFTDGVAYLIARSYTDTPDEAHFLNIDVDGKSRLLQHADLLHPLCVFARASPRRGGKRLRWLSGGRHGYAPVPADSTPVA